MFSRNCRGGDLTDHACSFRIFADLNEIITIIGVDYLEAMMGNLWKTGLLVLALALALVVCACSGDGGDEKASGDVVETPDGFFVDVETPPQQPVPVESLTGCALDSDCSAGLFCFQGACSRECGEGILCPQDLSCSARGRCLTAEALARSRADSMDPPGPSSGADGALVDTAPGLKLVSRPTRVQQVPPGVEGIQVTVETSAQVASGLLAYRVERTDGAGDATLVKHAEGTTSFIIEIDAGEASPDVDEPQAVEVYVITAAGAFRMSLIPQVPVSGTYSGYAFMNLFGGTGLPLDLQIVTNPPEATLESASEAWVVLPVGPEKLFSPHESFGGEAGSEYVTRPLKKDDFTGRWVATFISEYRLDSDSMLAAARILGQVRRTIRLELEPGQDAGLIIGSLSDRWNGLFDHRPEFGDRVPANVVFEGTLELHRVTSAASYKDVTPPQELGQGSPAPLPLPELIDCQDQHLAVEPEEEFSCDGLATLADFQLAGPEEQVACAIAVARAALAGQTTALEIQSFLDNSNRSGMSFAEFMERCAAGTEGTCRPTQEVLCAREMAAYAYAMLEGETTGTEELLQAYLETTREAFLGRQLGAFQTDAQTRMEWLMTSDYPAIVTSAVKNLIAGLLDHWTEKVLDVHLAVLSGQFDASGLGILSQTASGEEARAERKQLLMEMSQAWRASADALELAATRWNQLFQDDSSRLAKASLVSRRMFDLYLTAGMLATLNLANDADFASGTFAGGFANLVGALGQLVLPFDRLIYARDAEVVVSTSVDPLSNNSTLLSERKQAAMDEIQAAAVAVGEIIEESQAEALDQELLTNRMNNDINDLRSSLVELCGLPVGCTVESYRTDDSCEVRVAAGQCGFLIDKETNTYLEFQAGAQSVSEAGTALLGVRSAALAYEQVEEEIRAHTALINLELETTTAFARTVQTAHGIRLQLISDVAAAIADRNVAREGELAELFDNIQDRQERRATEFEAWGEALDDWDQVLLDGVESDFRSLTAATALEVTATTFRDAADATDQMTDIIKDGWPKCVGTSTDTFSAARLGVGLAAFGVTYGLRNGASVLDISAKALQNKVAKEKALRDAQLTLFQLHGDLEGAIMDSDVAELAEAAELADLASEFEEQKLLELIKQLELVAEAELAHLEDMTELADRQAGIKKMLIDSAGLELKLAQAEMTLTTAVQSYLQIAQRGGLQAAQIQDLERQRAEVISLVGSPAAVFSWANRLNLAEQRLIRAKSKLMDWLVALEYLAVRPFIDQRVQILLARNTYQLEDIAQEIDRLQGACGGAISTHTSDLSLRDDLLGLAQPLEDPVTGEVLQPAARFRALLERGYVPIDKRIRYSADSTIGGLLSSRSVLAATVRVSLDNFANLAATCNAKAYSIAVQLVGTDLGQAQPTVTILYDGASELQSCQPGLEEYLDAIGRESTSYGAVTRLNTAGRSVSPVAGINAFPETGGGNLSLAGLPLASEYTILIDPQIGENGKIDWSRLEDVRLRIEYTYQDFFPTGQCQ